MGKPTISVVTTTYNASAHIEQCLKSVAEQTYPAVEHVVIDGASTDGTPNIVRDFKRREGDFVSEPDHGIYDAMNKGIQRSKGDYIIILGADDRLASKNALELAAQALDLDRPDWAYGDLEVRQDGRADVYRPCPPEGALELMICGCLPHQSTLVSREFYERIGAFDPRYRIHADYEWFLRALATPDVRVRKLEVMIGSFAMGGASSQLREGQQEVFAIQNALPLYCTPEWMAKRLSAFQQQALQLRIDLAARQSAHPAAVTSIKDLARTFALRWLRSR